MAQYGVSYSDPGEQARRQQIFTDNLWEMLRINLKKAKNYWVKVNQFADRTQGGLAVWAAGGAAAEAWGGGAAQPFCRASPWPWQ